MLHCSCSGKDLDDFVEAALLFYGKQNMLDNTPISLSLEKDNDPRLSTSPLKFPGKLAIDVLNNRLFISDSNHNRIVSSLPPSQYHLVHNCTGLIWYINDESLGLFLIQAIWSNILTPLSMDGSCQVSRISLLWSIPRVPLRSYTKSLLDICFEPSNLFFKRTFSTRKICSFLGILSWECLFFIFGLFFLKKNNIPKKQSFLGNFFGYLSHKNILMGGGGNLILAS